jgi:hypothetical protein
MRYVKCSMLLLPVLFAAGCAPAPPPAKSVFDPLTEQLDHARAVQKTVDENAEKTRKALENQERGDAP